MQWDGDLFWTFSCMSTVWITETPPDKTTPATTNKQNCSRLLIWFLCVRHIFSLYYYSIIPATTPSLACQMLNPVQPSPSIHKEQILTWRCSIQWLWRVRQKMHCDYQLSGWVLIRRWSVEMIRLSVYWLAWLAEGNWLQITGQL